VNDVMLCETASSGQKTKTALYRYPGPFTIHHGNPGSTTTLHQAAPTLLAEVGGDARL